jgi:hypothetical protein
MGLLLNPVFGNVTSRMPRRSPLSTKDLPRVCLDWVFPTGTSETDALMAIRHLRNGTIPGDVHYGFQSMIGHREALILECTSPMSTSRAWPHCSQLIALSPSKCVVFTSMEQEAWTTCTDDILRTDVAENSIRLRWKSSRNAGRAFASPSVTPKAMAASMRSGTRKSIPSSHDYFTDVAILGEVGREDGEVIKALMNHLVNATGLVLKETSYQGNPQLGEYIHLATTDPSAPPGKVRILLSSKQEVEKVYATLQGQTIQVGRDQVGISVCNDIIDGAAISGNG